VARCIDVVPGQWAVVLAIATLTTEQVNALAQAGASIQTYDQIGPISHCTNQFAHSNDVHPRLCFGIWILDKLTHWLLYNILHLRELDEVIDALALVLEMEAGVLEGVRGVNNGLADVLHLLLRRDHYLGLPGDVRELNGELEGMFGLLRAFMAVAVWLGSFGGRAIR
jgi:hypothetical protein